MKRYKHNLSSRRLITGNFGAFIPAFVQEVLPGDGFEQSTAGLLRLLPLVHPVMHSMRIKFMQVYTPARLDWDDAEAFFTKGPAGTSAPVFPTMDFSGSPVAAGDLANHAGLPVGFAGVAGALQIRAIQRAWNDHIRDPLWQSELVISKASGNDTTTNRALQYVNWQKDPFTASHPEPQLGPDVIIPIGDEAPIEVIGTPDPTKYGRLLYHDTLAPYGAAAQLMTDAQSSIAESPAGTKTVYDPQHSLIADLSAVTGIPYSQLAISGALQRFMEHQMLSGSRMVDMLRRWGVRYSDGRLQRSEVLATGTKVIQVSEVLQQGGDAAGLPTGVGNMTGHGIAKGLSNRYRKHFEEWGHVVTFVSVMPESMYFQGVPKDFLKRAPEDFFTPEFEHIGEEEIEEQELYHASADPTDIWGYRPRYDTYRHNVNTVAGEFATTLKDFHMAREFGSMPANNAAFRKADTVTDRVFQDQTSDMFQLFLANSLVARRIVSASAGVTQL